MILDGLMGPYDWPEEPEGTILEELSYASRRKS
jgi:hypothetical protein